MILDAVTRADMIALVNEFGRLDGIPWPAPAAYIVECERAMVERASLECRPIADIVCDGWALLFAELDDLSEAVRDRYGLHPGAIAMRRHLARNGSLRFPHGDVDYSKPRAYDIMHEFNPYTGEIETRIIRWGK